MADFYIASMAADGIFSDKDYETMAAEFLLQGDDNDDDDDDDGRFSMADAPTAISVEKDPFDFGSWTASVTPLPFTDSVKDGIERQEREDKISIVPALNKQASMQLKQQERPSGTYREPFFLRQEWIDMLTAEPDPSMLPPATGTAKSVPPVMVPPVVSESDLESRAGATSATNVVSSSISFGLQMNPAPTIPAILLPNHSSNSFVSARPKVPVTPAPSAAPKCYIPIAPLSCSSFSPPDSASVDAIMATFGPNNKRRYSSMSWTDKEGEHAREDYKRQRNRVLAKKTRDKKKQAFSDLKEELLQLQTENKELKLLVQNHAFFSAQKRATLLQGCTAMDEIPDVVWEACERHSTLAEEEAAATDLIDSLSAARAEWLFNKSKRDVNTSINNCSRPTITPCPSPKVPRRPMVISTQRMTAVPDPLT